MERCEAGWRTIQKALDQKQRQQREKIANLVEKRKDEEELVLAINHVE
jgi:hypothetical protein